MADIVRTEEQIIGKMPIKVMLGDVEYDIHPLKITPARLWREKLIQETAGIVSELKPAADQNTFVRGLGFVFADFPEKVAELVFAYAPNLDQAKILEEATEEQLALVFGKIVQLAFPFVGELRMLTSAIHLAASFPQSAKSTK